MRTPKNSQQCAGSPMTGAREEAFQCAESVSLSFKEVNMLSFNYILIKNAKKYIAIRANFKAFEISAKLPPRKVLCFFPSAII